MNYAGLTDYDQSFSYDRAGRMTTNSRLGSYSCTSVGPAHARASLTPASGTSQSFSYDANGNMLVGLDDKAMTYDGENRPLSVTYLGTTTSYVYGADGKRRKKIVTDGTGTTTTTAYFGPVEIRHFGEGTNETILTYPHPNVRLENGQPSYLHHDALASVRGITGADGAPDSHSVYRPYGEQINWTQDATATPETKGFIGERYDEDAGLQYLNARYYDPKLALFIQPDWFEVTKQGVGTNRYAYSQDDPVNKMDPKGNVAFGDWGKNQEDSDRSNEEAAQRAEKAAEEIRSHRTLGDTIADWFGGARQADEAARAARARIGKTRTQRIFSDVGALVGEVLIGAVPEAKGLRAAAGAVDVAGSIRGVNPTGGRMNCVNCSIATDATLAGNPASALDGGATRINVLEKMFGRQFGPPGPIGEVSEAMSAAGSGARGIVFGSRGQNEVGHVFNVVNQKGVIRFLDGQTGKPASLANYSNFQLLRTN